MAERGLSVLRTNGVVRAVSSRLIRGRKPKYPSIRDFKSTVWQTPETSQGFVNGSDGAVVAIADVMDREVNRYFLEHCQAHDRVLDVGCGHGLVAEYLAEHGLRVVGVDSSALLLHRFRERIKDRQLPIEIVEGDAYKLPLPDNSFDKVVARMFLPHFPDWPVLLREMARVTVPGGAIMVHFPVRENGRLAADLAQREVRFATSAETKDPWFFYAEADEAELDSAAHDAGLAVVGRVPVSFFAHNRLIGRQLGQERYDRYEAELAERLKDPAVRDFVVWFDQTVTANATPAMSYFSIVTFQKA